MSGTLIRIAFEVVAIDPFTMAGLLDAPYRGQGPEKLEELMRSLAKKVQRFLVSEDGPTAVEYAVMLALIVIVCLTAIQAIGTNANATFNTIATKVGTVAGG